jgi:hypothetical protein
MKILDIITESTSPGTREDAIIADWLKNNPKFEVVEKVDPKTKEYAKGFFARNRQLNAEVMEKLSVRYGGAFTFLKLIGVIGPLALCIMELRALEEQAQQKDSAGNYVRDITWVKQQENAIVGVYVVSQIVPAILRSITGGVFISALRAMVSAGVMRTPAGGRGTFIAMLASQVAVSALQVWMNTPEGRQWCMHGFVMPLLIGGVGALSNIGLEVIRDVIKDNLGVDVGIVTPTVNQRKDDEKADNAGPTSDQIAKWRADSLTATNPIAPANRIK